MLRFSLVFTWIGLAGVLVAQTPTTSVTITLTSTQAAAITAALATGQAIHRTPREPEPIAAQPTTVQAWAQMVIDRATVPLMNEANAAADAARAAKLKTMSAAQCAAAAKSLGVDQIPGCGGGL